MCSLSICMYVWSFNIHFERHEGRAINRKGKKEGRGKSFKEWEGWRGRRRELEFGEVQFRLSKLMPVPVALPE